MSRLKFEAVKKPSGRSLQGINVIFGDKSIHFAPQAITVGEVGRPDLFSSSVNEFLDNFSDDDHMDLFRVYQTVDDVRNSPRVTPDDIQSIDDAMTTLFTIITQERIEAWGRDNDNYVMAASLDTIAPMRDGSISYSCKEEEYVDICILSTLFKILIPFQTISSHIADYLPDKVAPQWSLFTLINSAGMIESYPAYQQLISKSAAMADTHLGKGVPTGLTAKGIGEEEFYKIILIPKLFRELTRLETEVGTLSNGENNNISYKISRAIENRIKHDMKNNYRFNTSQGANPNDDDSGNTTRQELKAGGERISSIYGILYTKDFENFIDVVNSSEEMNPKLKIPANDVKKLSELYPLNLELHPAQEMIAGAIFDCVIPMDAGMYRPANSAAKILAYAACISKSLNLPNLYSLLTSAVNESGQLTESETRNSTIKAPIVHPKLPDVLDTYEEESKGNPFIIAMDDLIPKIIRSNFVIIIPQDGYEIGEEYYPRIINDMGIKDELVELFAYINGVYDD